MIRVSLAQMAAVALDTAANAAATSAAIDRAARDGAQLVVLPELIGTGYVTDADALAAVAEDVSAPGPVLRAWSEAARRTGTCVVGGLAERSGGRLYNSAVCIDETGAIAGVYRKLHLFGREHDGFTPGDRGLPIVELAGLRVGVLVCYDLRFPEAMRILALRGAELIAVPTAWVAGFDRVVPEHGRIAQVDGAIVQANLNQVYVACADQVGAAGRTTFLGRSVAVGPYGDVLAGPLSPTDEGLTTITVDATEVAAARHRGPGIDPLENRRTDVYDAYLGYSMADERKESA